MAQRLKGRIKHMNKNKGIGFIIGQDGKDLFFHFSDISDPDNAVELFDSVSFVLGQNKKGPCAIEIMVEEKHDAPKPIKRDVKVKVDKSRLFPRITLRG
jgi:CspA family cold shock protein